MTREEAVSQLRAVADINCTLGTQGDSLVSSALRWLTNEPTLSIDQMVAISFLINRANYAGAHR